MWTDELCDYYVDRNGDDAWPGTIDRPFATLAKAASKGGYLRVALSSNPHHLSSPVVYTDDRIQWVGPAGFTTITGDPDSLPRMFESKTSEGHNVFGGGWHNLIFDADAISDGGEAVLLRQINYARFQHVRIVGTGRHHKVALVQMSALPTSSVQDKSWLSMIDAQAHNAQLLKAPSEAGGCNGWYIEDVYGSSDYGATVPYVDLKEKIQGMFLGDGTFSNTVNGVPAVRVDESGVGQSRSVNIVAVDFDHLGGYAIELVNTQSYVEYGGPEIVHGMNVTGYMNVPQQYLAGTLHEGAN